MRAHTFYTGLGALSLAIAASAGILAVLGLAFAQPISAGAAALCTGVFVAPGLILAGYARHLAVREAALKHVNAIAQDRDILDANVLAEELKVSREDAEKILKIGAREGHLQGTFDAKGRFITASAPRCPSCGTPYHRNLPSPSCAVCGAAIPR